MPAGKSSVLVLDRFSVDTAKTHNQTELEEERVYFTLQFLVHLPGNLREKLLRRPQGSAAYWLAPSSLLHLL